jgi:8-oxo-dGTP pyrophosphatase MutT (NUDIX family)
MKRGKYRKSVFIVTYAKEDNEIFYLILKRKLHWKGWEFPKGGIKSLETKKRAIKREIKEETGLKPLNIRRFNFSGKFKYEKELKDRPGIVGQSFSLYSCEILKKKIKFDKREHTDYKWVDFKEVMKKLRWPNQRKSLKMVNERLNI